MDDTNFYSGDDSDDTYLFHNDTLRMFDPLYSQVVLVCVYSILELFTFPSF